MKDYISVTSDWISYALIDDITDAFGPLIQSIEYEVDSIDELVLILKEAEQSDMLRRCVASLAVTTFLRQINVMLIGLVHAARKSWAFYGLWATKQMS